MAEHESSATEFVTRRHALIGALGVAGWVFAGQLPARAAPAGFDEWRDRFRARAVARGVSEQTYIRVMGKIEPDMRAWPGLHARLAILTASNAPPMLSRVLRSGTVFWVTAHERPAIPAALRASGGAGRFLVIPVEFEPPGAAFTVAGCAGWRVGARSRAVGKAA